LQSIAGNENFELLKVTWHMSTGKVDQYGIVGKFNRLAIFLASSAYCLPTVQYCYNASLPHIKTPYVDIVTCLAEYRKDGTSFLKN
jgi:hypothetical protein